MDAGCVVPEPPPPPQLINGMLASATASTTAANFSLRARGERAAGTASDMSNKADNQQNVPSIISWSLVGRAACCEDVEIVTVTFTALPGNVALEGEMEHAASGGKFVQLKVSWPVKPPSGVIVRL